jgi:hypothetical protein
MKAGKGRPAAELFAEMEEKYNIPLCRRGPGARSAGLVPGRFDAKSAREAGTRGREPVPGR